MSALGSSVPFFSTASSDTTAKIWDADTCELIGPELEHSELLTRARLAPDNRSLVTAGVRTINCWHVAKPFPDNAEDIRRWISTVSGLTLKEDESIYVQGAKDIAQWQKAASQAKKFPAESQAPQGE